MASAERDERKTSNTGIDASELETGELETGVASKRLTLEHCRAAKCWQLLIKISLVALALILLAVSVSKSTNASANSKNGRDLTTVAPPIPP